MGGFLLLLWHRVLCLFKRGICMLFKEVKYSFITEYFINDVGEAFIYDEGARGYTIERRIKKSPGVYRCRVYHAADIAGARKRFNQIKGTLTAIQTRRDKKK